MGACNKSTNHIQKETRFQQANNTSSCIPQRLLRKQAREDGKIAPLPEQTWFPDSWISDRCGSSNLQLNKTSSSRHLYYESLNDSSFDVIYAQHTGETASSLSMYFYLCVGGLCITGNSLPACLKQKLQREALQSSQTDLLWN